LSAAPTSIDGLRRSFHTSKSAIQCDSHPANSERRGFASKCERLMGSLESVEMDDEQAPSPTARLLIAMPRNGA
jgi:hypothetical protein